MKNARQRLALFGGLAAAVLLTAARVYNHRSRERVGGQSRGTGRPASSPGL
jgi:hypothetical protein